MIHNMSSLASFAGDQSSNHLSTDPREMRWWHSPMQPSSVDSAKWPGDLPSSLFSIAVKTLTVQIWQIHIQKYIVTGWKTAKMKSCRAKGVGYKNQLWANSNWPPSMVNGRIAGLCHSPGQTVKWPADPGCGLDWFSLGYVTFSVGIAFLLSRGLTWAPAKLTNTVAMILALLLLQSRP